MKTYLIVLFNLKSTATVADYERWAAATDIPVVRKLKSVSEYNVYKSITVRNADVPPPYQYVEVIEIADMAQFAEDVAQDQMKQVAAEMRTFADAPLFVLSERLG